VHSKPGREKRPQGREAHLWQASIIKFKHSAIREDETHIMSDWECFPISRCMHFVDAERPEVKTSGARFYYRKKVSISEAIVNIALVVDLWYLSRGLNFL
jgi:hypothetical protein